MSEKFVINQNNYVCAVAGSKEHPQNAPDLDFRIVGTGTLINRRTLITAAHVLEDEKFPHQFVVQTRPDKSLEYSDFRIEKAEFFPDLDIAIVHLEQDVSFFVYTPWQETELNLLDDVFSFGYPLAIENPAEKRILSRAFKGHVTTPKSLNKGKLPTSRLYELSFACPRGLSGAPLFRAPKVDSLLVTGIIIGNEVFDHILESSIQSDVVNNILHKIERVESAHRGICLQASAILPLFSKHLKCTVSQIIEAGK